MLHCAGYKLKSFLVLGENLGLQPTAPNYLVLSVALPGDVAQAKWPRLAVARVTSGAWQA